MGDSGTCAEMSMMFCGRGSDTEDTDTDAVENLDYYAPAELRIRLSQGDAILLIKS